MRRITLALVPMIVGLVGVLFTGFGGAGYAANNHLGIPHNADGQVGNSDVQQCLGGTTALTGGEDATGFPAIGACVGETLTTGAAITSYTDVVVHKGNRLSLPFSYTPTAFGLTPPANGTTIGGVKAAINIGCDDVVDYFADSSSTIPYGFGTNVPEPFVERTTAWGPGTGIGGSSEAFLDGALPGPLLATRTARARADIDFVTLGTSIATVLASPTSLNAVTLTPVWGASRVQTTLLGGDANAPSAQLVLCLDSPQTSTSNTLAVAGATNPAVAGLYALWTTEVTAAGIRDEQVENGSIITYCKKIGGAFTDADNDCWDDAADTNTGNADQDSDGLLDGIEITWLGPAVCPAGGASPVLTKDCDGDGKTDLEEMLQTAASLTNPRVADSDADGFLDSGINYDCDGDGVPDNITRDNAGAGTGRNRTRVVVQYCKPTGGNTTDTTAGASGFGGRPVGNPGAASEDNCPNNANPTQLNTSLADPDLDALPAPGDTNGRFGGTADNTHADAHFNGDACDGDRDGDGIPDTVEDLGTMFYSAAGAGSKFCNLDGTGVAADTDSGNRDSDGDGSIDGVECQLGTNPASAASKPGVSLTTEQQTYYRLKNLTQVGGPVLADLDDLSAVVGGVAETKGNGAGAASSNDVDRDGCSDEVEYVDLDGNRTAGDPDRLGIARAALGITPFTGGLTAEEKRSADIDFNGTIGDPDRLGAARVVLTAGLPTIPNFNLSCNATGIGYAAN